MQNKQYQKPEEFIPLAQTILINNVMPIFDNNSGDLSDRLNIINFTVEHHPNDSKKQIKIISPCAYTVNTEFAACALKITALIMEKSK